MFDSKFNQEAVNAHYREELRKNTNLYGSKLSQTERFRNALRYFDFNEKMVLDVGCGKGDFWGYIMRAEQCPLYYIGVDPLQEMINIACVQLQGRFNYQLFCGNYLDIVPTNVDIAVAFSVFDKKFGNLVDSKGYMWQMIEKMIYDAEEGIYITLLSAHKIINDFSEALFYPTDVYKYARSFAERVVIDSSYMPHAFSLIVYNQKSPWRVEWEKK